MTPPVPPIYSSLGLHRELPSHRDLRGRDLRGRDLRWRDLRGRDLRGKEVPVEELTVRKVPSCRFCTHTPIQIFCQSGTDMYSFVYRGPVCYGSTYHRPGRVGPCLHRNYGSLRLPDERLNFSLRNRKKDKPTYCRTSKTIEVYFIFPSLLYRSRFNNNFLLSYVSNRHNLVFMLGGLLDCNRYPTISPESERETDHTETKR